MTKAQIAINIPADLTPLNRIRVETALSRLPFHCLTKKGRISIDLKNAETNFRWKVSYNPEYGQPGPLAYKVDTLIVNRRIDEAPRPLPEVVELGSLRGICRELGITDHNTEMVKTALLQNATATIDASIKYRTKNGSTKSRQFVYARYSVYFAGETLPDGREAEFVCIALSHKHRELLNHVQVRPLDYDYLMRLPPGPQRFYEMVSFQIYGTIAGDRPRAKMLYSEYCQNAPQTRYYKFDQVKKQMFKLHAPHRDSGYLDKIDYEMGIDAFGDADWEMLYTPGPKAWAEYQAFSERQSVTPTSILPAQPSTKPCQLTLHGCTADDTLLAELAKRGITEKKACALLAQCQTGQPVLKQIQYVDDLIADSPRGKFRNPAGLYVRFIEENWPVPNTGHAIQGASSEQTEYDEHCQQKIEYFALHTLSRPEYRRKFKEYSQEIQRAFPTMLAEQIEQLAHAAVCAEVRDAGWVKLPTIEEFYQSRRG